MAPIYNTATSQQPARLSTHCSTVTPLLSTFSMPLMAQQPQPLMAITGNAPTASMPGPPSHFLASKYPGYFKAGVLDTVVDMVSDAYLARDPADPLAQDLRMFIASQPFQVGLLNVHYYFGYQSPFSHFYPCYITTQGHTWHSAEQAFQYARAVVQRCPDVQQAIQLAKDPKTCKKLSRCLPATGTLHRYWSMVAPHVMLAIDYKKFLEKPTLLEKLLDTKDFTLVENNLTDIFWGPPCNVAGQILQTLRDHFRRTTLLPGTYWIGDSVIRQLAPLLPPGHRVISIPGITARNLAHFIAWLFPENAARIVLVVGTNDLYCRFSKRPLITPAKMVNLLSQITYQIHRTAPCAKVHITQILNRPCDALLPIPSRVSSINKAVKKACAEKKISAISINTPYLATNYFLRDGLHPTQKGLSLCSLAWLNSLSPLLGPTS